MQRSKKAEHKKASMRHFVTRDELDPFMFSEDGRVICIIVSFAERVGKNSTHCDRPNLPKIFVGENSSHVVTLMTTNEAGLSELGEITVRRCSPSQ
jgi:hypothetical protein